MIVTVIVTGGNVAGGSGPGLAASRQRRPAPAEQAQACNDSLPAGAREPRGHGRQEEEVEAPREGEKESGGQRRQAELAETLVKDPGGHNGHEVTVTEEEEEVE
mmetsp:Transcript_66415/g.138424  ORF Transcript_66415/g.138424 Transcript_66415/m.138424 type:complete len:104 (+) Transcript_66415:106-417(+)